MNGDRIVNRYERIEDGDLLTITMVAKDGAWMDPTGRVTSRLANARGPLGSMLRSVGTVVRPAPAIKFEPGDVLVCRFNGPGSTPYTYVRGAHDFPGDGCRKSDAEMSRAVMDGTAVLIARNGVALPGPITRDNLHLLPTIPF